MFAALLPKVFRQKAVTFCQSSVPFPIFVPANQSHNAMDKHLDFFNYEACLTYYKGRIQNINQAKKHGEVSVAKPVLIVAIIDSITCGEVMANRIPLTEELMARYKRLMDTYAKELTFYSSTAVSNPFWHLQGDGFWHLIGAECIKNQKITPSVTWIQEYVNYACLDDALWVLLQNKTTRMMLREYIIEHKLTTDSWSSTMAAEALSIIAALVIAA